MQISIDDVYHIAGLARLAMTEEEAKQYAGELSAIFSYMDLLGEVETEDVEETCQVTGLTDVTREDEVQMPSKEERERLRKNFPDSLGNLLKVKAVFDETQ